MNLLRATQRRRRHSRRTAQGLRWAALAAAIALVLTESNSPEAGSPAMGIDISWPVWGFTHTQYSADYGSARAVAAVQQALASQPMVQNQHIMGWGGTILNPPRVSTASPVWTVGSTSSGHRAESLSSHCAAHRTG